MLTEFPNGVLELISLTDLDLSQNYLRSIPKDIQRLQDLRVLVLHVNQLSDLPVELQVG